MSYYRENPFNNSSNYHNFNLNDLNMEVYFPYPSNNPNQNYKRKQPNNIKRHDTRNISRNEFDSNPNISSLHSKLPIKENFNFNSYYNPNFNLPISSVCNKTPEDQKSFSRPSPNYLSEEYEDEMVNYKHHSHDINSIVDNYFRNKFSLESEKNIWNSNHKFAPFESNKQNRQNSFENYYASGYSNKRLSLQNLNISGNYSTSSNSDENTAINCEQQSNSNRRSDSKEECNRPIKRVSSSLFLNDKDSKGEDFADLEELMSSIKIDLWEYAKTQKGSRNLQKLLNKIQPERIDTLLEKVKDNFPEIMKDTYGNYFCQKLIQSCSADQRIFILQHILNDFADISCHNSGTHALQSMIEIINLTGEEEIIKEAIKNNILTLSFNPNGTHVMQKIITSIKEQNREHINKTVLENMNKLINDSNGVCVLKKFINSNKNETYRNFILNQVSSNSLEIVQNPFGNYLIQHILDEWGQESAGETIDMIISNIVSLSMQKFSSNVVEKCFDVIDMPTRIRMCKELFNPCKISSLLKNKYGNFVLQKAIQSMTIEERIEIGEVLAKRVKYTSNKEKARFNSLIEIIQSSAM